MVSIQEVKHGVNVCLKALPYVKGDPGVSFKWSRDGGSCNELRLEKMTTEHCTGYYSCEIIKNGEHLFSVHHCLKATSKLVNTYTQYNYSTITSTSIATFFVYCTHFKCSSKLVVEALASF